MTWQALKDHFKTAGDVLKADVMMDDATGRSKGCGIVKMASAQVTGYSTPTAAAATTVSFSTTGNSTTGNSISPHPPLPPAGRRERQGAAQRLGALRPLDLRPRGPRAGCVPAAARPPALTPLRPPRPPRSPFFSLRLRLAGLHDQLIYSTAPGGKGGAGGGAGCKLFVGNLSYDTTWQDLKDLMKTAGEPLRADVATGADGQSKGFGTVTFASTREAAKAIQALNESEFQGRIIEVRPDAM